MPKLREDWPVLTHYDQEHLARVALPLGGIGTGTVSLGGRGNLQDWEIVNRPAKGFNGGQALFALYACEEGGLAVSRALEGILQPPYEGAFGSTTPYHGLPRFRQCSFHVAYPLAQITLNDPQVPLDCASGSLQPSCARRCGCQWYPGGRSALRSSEQGQAPCTGHRLWHDTELHRYRWEHRSC